jgi:hypothetical protein
MERQVAHVAVEISFHQVLKALTQMAYMYPCERLAPVQIDQIEHDARVLRERLKEYYDAKRKD